MQVLVSFSTVVRFVLWLAVAAILAGGVLVDQLGGTHPDPAREVAVQVAPPGR